MSWPTFTAISGAWLFALAVPLTALYFLKLKRPLLLVPSTALWRRVIDDQRVNSPFQRFKRHLLLWLQLLLLCLLATAAMQPVMRAPEAFMVRRPIFVDNSASMAALHDGRSRLDEAKQLVGKLIDDLLPDQQLAIVSFAGRARSRCGFTGNKRQLRAALAAIEVEDVPSNLEDAMRVARALSRGASFDEAWIVSDGNLPENTQTDLSFELRVKLVAQAGDNIGIAQAGARRGRDGDWLVFVEVAGTHEELTATLSLQTEDGTSLGEERIALSGGAGSDDATEGASSFRARRLFRVGEAAAGPLTLRLTPDGFDALKSDDTAYLDLPRPRPLRVFCAPGLDAYRFALSTLPGLALEPAEGAGSDAAPEGHYDLVITDRPPDFGSDTAALLTIGHVPVALEGIVRQSDEDEASTEVVDWRRRDDLLLHVGLGELTILADPRWKAGADESALERAGFELLVHGRSGPLLVRAGQGQPRYHMLFHSDRSTLPYRVGFPVLVTNLIDLARRSAGLAEVRGALTGVLPPIQLDAGRYADTEVTVDGPAGSMVRQTSEHGVLGGVAAPLVGRYQVREGGEDLTAVGVALLSAEETQLRRVDKIQFRESLAVGVDGGPVETDRALWHWLALVGLAVLCVEWWFFNLMGKRLR